MRCPGCGADVSAGTIDCPFCGRHLAEGTTGDMFTSGGSQTSGGFGAGYPSTPSYGNFGSAGAPAGAQPSAPLSYGAGGPQQPQSGGWPGYPQQYPPAYGPGQGQGYPQGMGQAAPPSQGFAQGYPPQGYPQGYPPQGYPQGYPPQGYGPEMGQAAPPSQGFAPGYPPQGYSQGMGQAAPPSQGFTQGYPPMGQAAPASQVYPGYPGGPGGPGSYAPPMPEKKRSKGMVIALSAVAVALVVLVVAGVVALSAIGSPKANTSNTSPGTSTTTSTSTAPAEVLLQDSLLTNANGWQGTGCAIKSDGLHINGSNDCQIPASLPNDVDIKVTTTIVKISTDNTDNYGLGLRGGSAGAYFFVITQDGSWAVLNCANGGCKAVSDPTANSAIKTGVGAVNTIEARVKGSTFDFYDNGTHLGTLTDSSYTSGGYALAGGNASVDDILFTNLLVTKVTP